MLDLNDFDEEILLLGDFFNILFSGFTFLGVNPAVFVISDSILGFLESYFDVTTFLIKFNFGATVILGPLSPLS